VLPCHPTSWKHVQLNATSWLVAMIFNFWKLRVTSCCTVWLLFFPGMMVALHAAQCHKFYFCANGLATTISNIWRVALWGWHEIFKKWHPERIKWHLGVTSCCTIWLLLFPRTILALCAAWCHQFCQPEAMISHFRKVALQGWHDI